MNPVIPPSNLKAVDFFCSAGGVTCGLRQAGINVLGGIDHDERCWTTYESNNKGSVFIPSDISELSTTDLQRTLALSRYDDDLIFIGCSPCQYYSIINTSREKSHKSRLLLAEFERFVNHFRPGYVLVENVPGLGTKAGSPLADFKKNLIRWDYTFDERIVNASHYGVAQSRKRYILMATRLGSSIGIPSGDPDKITTVKQVIGPEEGFYEIEAGHFDSTSFIHTATSLSPLNIERLLATPFDGGTRLAWKDNPRLQLRCYQGRDSDFRDVYGRMFWNLPAPTITTKFISITNGRFAHPQQHRGLSLREGARLQSFPKEYTFDSGSIRTIAQMIGNAVPPELAKHIGLSFIKHHNHATV